MQRALSEPGIKDTYRNKLEKKGKGGKRKVA